MHPLITLASKSPRRKRLLSELIDTFEVLESGVEEAHLDTVPPGQLVMDLAVAKADAVAKKSQSGIVIGADTIIDLDQRVIGKPADTDDAARILRLLRSRSHLVKTGLAIVDCRSGETRVRLVSSQVEMRAYSDSSIQRYIETGEPMDKAGAYAIQGRGRDLIEATTGCLTNVIGLPLCEMAILLGDLDIPLKDPSTPCRLETGDPCPRIR